ncbi:MAG: hypothetical protein R2862_02450 [Thermoanaerobaculia bacterium]
MVGAPLHTVTQKGKGYRVRGERTGRVPRTVPLRPGRRDQKGKSASAPTTSVFGKTIVRLAERDPRVVAITASMPDGTGLNAFSERFPDRFLNTGIAEQHSVTLAAGLALGGSKPVVAIYSTFLQRGFDQVFHDVCLQWTGAGRLRDGPWRHRRQRRLDAPRTLRLSPTSGSSPTPSSWRRRTRTRCSTCWRRRSSSRIRRRCVIRAAAASV